MHHVTARVDGAVDAGPLAAVPGVRGLAAGDGTLELQVAERALDDVVKFLARHHVLDVEITEADLEEMFLTFYAEEPVGAA
jgi:ABC-2 type transport system ATP-binding protein